MEEQETTKRFLPDITNEVEAVKEPDKPQETPWSQKFFLALMLYLTYTILGIGSAIPGATILDLALITNSSISDTSTVITARSLGGFLGSFLLPIMSGRFSHWVPLGLGQLCTSLLLTAVPWCPTLPPMVALFAIHGISRRFIDGACYTAMVDIWGVDNAPWMAGLCCVYGVGCLISPFIVKPFITTASSLYTNTTQVPQTNTTPTLPNNTRSLVHVPYIITGFLFALNALILLVIALVTYKCWYIESQIEKPSKRKSQEHCEKNSSRKKSLLRRTLSKLQCTMSFELVLTFLQGVFTFAHTLIEFSCMMFLVVFLVEYDGWEKGKAVVFLSIFFTCYTASRGIGAIINKYIPTKITIIVCIAFVVTASVTLAITMHYHYIIVWITLICLAVFTAPLYAAGLTFCDAYIPLNSTVISGTQFGSSIAGVVSPFMFGAWYNLAGPFVFVYILIMSCSLLIACFSSMFILAQRHGERNKEQGTLQPVDI